MNLNNKKIAFLGDSITQGVGVKEIEQVYWKRIENATGANCYGYGISGTTIAPRWTPRPEESANQYFGSRIQNMIPDADVVVVFGGTNDFGWGDASFGDVNGKTEHSFCSAFHKLLQGLILRYPKAQLVVMTPLHRLEEDAIGANELGIRREYRLEDYVNAIITICGYYSIPVLDLYRVSGIQPSVSILRETYMPDGLHPNEAGHELIAKKLTNFLNYFL